MAYDNKKDKQLLEEKICDGKNGTQLWGSVHSYAGKAPGVSINRWYGDDIKKLGRMSFDELEAVGQWMEKLCSDRAKYETTPEATPEDTE